MGDWIAELVAQGQAENKVETEVQVKKVQCAEDSEQESSSAGVEDPNGEEYSFAGVENVNEESVDSSSSDTYTAGVKSNKQEVASATVARL